MVVRELGHRGQGIGAPGQGHQQRAQEHGQRIAHAARVARIGEVGQGVGEGAQGLPQGGVDDGERRAWDRIHEGRNAYCEDCIHPIGRTAALFVARRMAVARQPV